MSRELRYLLAAIAFFTRLPVPVAERDRGRDLDRAIRYHSLVGWIVGGAAALMFWMAHLVVPPEIAIALSMVFSILLTGAFHEDGLADACDGFGGGSDRAAVLRIMKDSRVGTYGVAGLVAVLALKFLSLSALTPSLVVIALLSGHSISRFASASLVHTQRNVGAGGMGSKTEFVAESLSGTDLVLLAVFGLSPLLLLEPGFWPAAFAPLLVRLVAGWYFALRIGGYTGDCLGAIQQVSEAAFYLALAAAAGR